MNRLHSPTGASLFDRHPPHFSPAVHTYTRRVERPCLATLKPTALLAIFNVPQLEQVAQEVETTILKIMNEAAG